MYRPVGIDGGAMGQVVGPDGETWVVQDETPRLQAPRPAPRPSRWQMNQYAWEGRRTGLLDTEVPTGDLLGDPTLFPERTWDTAAFYDGELVGRAARDPSPSWIESTRAVDVWEAELQRMNRRANAAQLVGGRRETRGPAEYAFADRLAQDDFRLTSPSPQGANAAAAAAESYGAEPIRYHGAHRRGARMPREESMEGSYPDEQGEFPRNLGVGAEWRSTIKQEGGPSKDDLMVRALTQITSALQNISTPVATGPEIEFSGDPGEDPSLFMQRLEEWFAERGTPEDRRGVVMRRCLRGVALQWFADVQAQEWPLVRSLFMQRWDSESRKTELWRRLFGVSQANGERVAPFVMRKWGLFQRLAPEMPVERKVNTIIELLVSDLRRFCRTVQITTLEDLLELTIKLERDCWGEGAARNDVPSTRPVAAPRRSEPGSRPAAVPQGRYTPTPPQNRPQPAPRQGPANQPPRAAREPYPCRWCGSMGHFNNNCPRRPRPNEQPIRRSGPTPPPEGNGPRATAAARDQH